MATWIDYITLLVTVAVLGGVVYGVVYAVNVINEGMSSTKAQLKERGLDVSASGVSVKTNKRFDREDYVDAMQRGMINSMGAVSFRKGGASEAPPLGREPSNASIKSTISTTSTDEKKKKKGIFNSRK